MVALGDFTRDVGVDVVAGREKRGYDDSRFGQFPEHLRRRRAQDIHEGNTGGAHLPSQYLGHVGHHLNTTGIARAVRNEDKDWICGRAIDGHFSTFLPRQR